MVESYIAGERPKQGNPTAEKHRDTRDDQALDQACFQEALDGHSAIHINLLEATCAESRYHFWGRAGHHVTHGAVGRPQRCRPCAEHHDRLCPIGPGIKGEDRLKGLAADDDGIDRRDELVVPMRLATVRWQPVQCPSCRAMKPSRLVAMNTDALI